MSDPVQAAEFFDAQDVDGSGSLTRSELETVLRGKGYSRSQIDVIFSEVELDGDGVITKDEFLTYLGHCDPGVHAEARKKSFFARYDKDRDGNVDKDELKQAMAESDIEWSDDDTERMYAILDKDDTGTITMDELITELYGAQD